MPKTKRIVIRTVSRTHLRMFWSLSRLERRIAALKRKKNLLLKQKVQLPQTAKKERSGIQERIELAYGELHKTQEITMEKRKRKKK